MGLAVAVLVQKYRRGGPLGRQQTLIFGAAFVPPLAALVASFSDAAGPWLFAVATIPSPIAIGVAVLQRRLYDIQLAVNRSLTYGTLWLAIAVLYAVVVGGVGVMLRRPDAVWLPWLAAGVVAVTFAPLRDALQRGANRLTYGQWSQPAEVLAATARRLGDAGDVPSLLRSLVDDVGHALDLPYVEITDPDGATLALRGAPPRRRRPAAHDLVRRRGRARSRGRGGRCATPTGSSSPTSPASSAPSSTRSACSTPSAPRRSGSCSAARRNAAGCGATCTTASAPRSPACCCTSTRCGTSCAAGSAPTRRRAADEGLLALRSGIQGTVADVRRIVEGLRPPALDELGPGRGGGAARRPARPRAPA